MKTNYLFLLMSSLFALASCNGQLAKEQEAGEGTRITFSIYDAEKAYDLSKATGVINDANVDNVQFFIFNADNTLNAYHKTTGSSATFRISNNGPVNCYALVNCAADLSTIYTESELLAQKSLLDDNAGTRLHMFGSMLSQDLGVKTEMQIPVSRFAAKVSIDRVEVAFASAALRARPFKITGIYLINANSRCTFQGMAPDYRWMNRKKYVSGECSALLADTGLNIPLSADSPMTTAHSFYCYPNHNTADDPYTRLVVETLMNNNTRYYYSVNIGDSVSKRLESNRHYHISKMTITGLGSVDPDVIPSLANVNFSVDVRGWDIVDLDDINY